MVGIYPNGWPEQSTIDNEMRPVDNWVTSMTGGRSTSIFGTFLNMMMNDTIAKANVEMPLTIVWNNGYTPFVNLPVPGSAYDVASGKYDAQFTSFAKSYKNYAASGRRFAYIAPMQEMNGEWTSYGKDPSNFILGYKRIQDIFSQNGVPRSSVKWVFAPNGWTKPGLPTFERYYPGDAYVDVTAISSYNFGYCHGGTWQEPVTVFNPTTMGSNGYYLDRMRKLAPTKPIFIAQTASSSWKSSGNSNYAEKDRWLADAYNYLAGQANVKAVIYFNTNKECDWAVYIQSKVQFQGYRTGVNGNGYSYISPDKLMSANH